MRYFLIIIALLGLDQLSKWYIVSHFALGQSVPVLGILNITYVQNTGAAFSLFSSGTWFLIVLTIVVLIAVAYCWRKPFMKPYHLYTAVIVGGALGNFVDRVFRGYVVDFFQVTFINFPVFNVADVLLCCGVALLALKIIFTKEETLNENNVS